MDLISIKQPPNGLLKAIGDGVKDDTAAIQAILDYVGQNGGGKVLIPNGIYMINAISTTTVTGGIKVNYDNIEIVLSPNATLKVIPNSSPRYDLISFKSIKNGKISGGKLEGDRIQHNYSSVGVHQFGNGILIYSSLYVTIENISITGFTGDGITLYGSNNPSEGYHPSRYVNILNNTIDMSRRNNISAITATDILISGNNILNAGAYDGVNNGTDPKAGIDIEGGSNPSRVIISNNIFKNNIGGSLIIYNGNDVVVNGNISDNFFAYQNASNTVITNNELKKHNATNHSGIEQTTGSMSPSVSGTMLAVGSKYQINSRSTLDFTTVGATNNKAGTIFIATASGPLGTGDSATRILENILITSNEIYGFKDGISNTGSTANVVIRGNILNSQSSTGINVGSNTSILENSLYNQAIAIRVNGTNITVQGNTIDIIQNRGIYCLGSSSIGRVLGNNIRNFNTLNSAIEVSEGTWTIVDNVLECGIAGTTGYGIYNTSADTRIINNLISGGSIGGGVIRLTQRANVVGNRIVGVTAPYGIYATSSNASRSIIAQNYIEMTNTSGKRYGIFFSGGGTGVKITNNEVHNNSSEMTNSINTSANTTSLIARNLTTSGAILGNVTDTITENLQI